MCPIPLYIYIYVHPCAQAQEFKSQRMREKPCMPACLHNHWLYNNIWVMRVKYLFLLGIIMIEQRRQRRTFPGRLAKPVKTGKTNSQTVFLFVTVSKPSHPLLVTLVGTLAKSVSIEQRTAPGEPILVPVSRRVGQSLTLHREEILLTGPGQGTIRDMSKRKNTLLNRFPSLHIMCTQSA